MDIVTNEYNNISITQLTSQLMQKLGELDKIDTQNIQAQSFREDYFDISNSNNYDKQDFARVLDKFKTTDHNIRSHEQTHATIGHTTAPISYTYQEGPDGKLYAVGGSVRLDTSIPKDPKEAEIKLDQIEKSVNAVSNQSGADSNIALQASLNKMLILSKNNTI